MCSSSFAQPACMLFLIKPDLDPFDTDDRNQSWFKSPCRGARIYDNTVELEKVNQEAINQLRRVMTSVTKEQFLLQKALLKVLGL